MEEWTKEIRLVHGEKGAKVVLADLLQDRYRRKGLAIRIMGQGNRNIE